MGEKNSSLTRVQPVFDALLALDPTGRSWLPAILGIAPHNGATVAPYLNQPDGLVAACSQKRAFTRDGDDPRTGPFELRGCFERQIAAPSDFLRWLIKSPHKVQWPDPFPAAWSDTTTDHRTNLKDGPASARKATQAEALRKLDAAVARKGELRIGRQWWVFEGQTHVDCLLETESLVVAFEGKRTEQPSAGVSYYSPRDQVVRNVEALSEYAGRKAKAFAVLIAYEDHVTEPTKTDFQDSLPHLDAKAVDDLRTHYLGAITWGQICAATGLDFDALPDTVGDLL